jgi:hypothetical protein
VTMEDARRFVALLKSYQKHIRGVLSTQRRILAILAAAPEDTVLRRSTLVHLRSELTYLLSHYAANVTALLATPEPHEPLPNDES